MHSGTENTQASHLTTAIALSVLFIGAGVCIYSFSAVPEWYATIAHMDRWQQLRAFALSEFLPLVVLNLMWLERVLMLGYRSVRKGGFSRYHALSRTRKLFACVVSGLLAAAATTWAMLVALDFSPQVAMASSVVSFGVSMFWLEWRVVFAVGAETGSRRRDAPPA